MAGCHGLAVKSCEDVSNNRRQKTEDRWFVAFGESTCCRVWLVLFSLLVVASLAMRVYLKIGYFYRKPIENL
jgi:hypothetical protein